MSSNIKKQFEEVKQHIIHGKFQEGLKVIEDNLKKKDISKEEKLGYLNFKAEISFYLGNLQDALQLADQVLDEIKGQENSLLQVDALTIKSITLIWLAKFKEGIEIAEKGLKIILEIKNLPTKELAERKAYLLLFKTSGELQLGDYENGIDVLKEALSYAEECGNKFKISLSLCFLGVSYMQLENNLEKSEEHLEKAHILATDLGNNFSLSIISIFFANLSSGRRKHEEAIDFFNKAFSLSKEIGSTLLLGYINDMGNIYLYALYQLEKALECYQETLKYPIFGKHIAYVNIGYIYFLKNELGKAQEYYQKSLKISEGIGDRRVLPNVLFNLISLSIELKKFEQAKQYLNRLEEIREETGFKHISLNAHFASILILKASGDISDLVEASKLLDAFLAIDNLHVSWRLQALYLLLEIRIKELQISSNESALEEVKKQAIRLEVEAEEQQYHWLLANVYRLQSQLALVELNAQSAIKLLEKARTIADEINNKILKKAIKEDQEKIDKQLGMLNDLQKQKAPINETIKLVSLESTVKNIKQETVLEDRDESGQIIEYRKLFALKI